MTDGILTSAELSTYFPEQAISNHPTLTYLKRTVQMGGFGLGILPGQQQIQVNAIVKHYDTRNSNVYVNDSTASDFIVTFEADINHWVNPTTFVRVQADGNGDYPAGSVRERDAWVNLFGSSAQQIFSVINNQLLSEDQLGRYNNNYSPQAQPIQTVLS